ncbi:hypothetical protein [Variovorax sp. SRS16]|uniref:hypothetical protein n=1 Tax=Variovorax sp. SRS16 TaxID=282217 RepID=UPI001E35BD3E|nr:hypothetical protein [Variovorax sp. SRS16]
MSILVNQISVQIDSGYEWGVLDLRNVVKGILQLQLAIIGFLKGYAYDFAVTRVINHRREIDYVFGIDVPCISKPRETTNLEVALTELRGKVLGQHGVFVQRCLSDLLSALKNADDTGFYCYRAIESLRHHCAAVHGVAHAGKAVQWVKFQEVSGATEEVLRAIKAEADPLRHGDVFGISEDNSVKLLTSTWEVVEGYFKSVINESRDSSAAAGPSRCPTS